MDAVLHPSSHPPQRHSTADGGLEDCAAILVDSAKNLRTGKRKALVKLWL